MLNSFLCIKTSFVSLLGHIKTPFRPLLRAHSHSFNRQKTVTLRVKSSSEPISAQSVAYVIVMTDNVLCVSEHIAVVAVTFFLKHFLEACRHFVEHILRTVAPPREVLTIFY